MVYVAEAMLFYVGAVLVARKTYSYLQMVEVLNLVVVTVTIGSQMLTCSKCFCSSRTRISASAVANLLHFPDNPDAIAIVEMVAQSLYAVLYVSINDGCIYWYHPSFQDFIFDAQRSRFAVPGQTEHLNMSCDQPSFHARLAQRCFHVMSLKLHFNICELPSSFLLDSEVHDLKARVCDNISEVLQYSCRYWGQHLAQATDAETEKLTSSLRCFLDERLLFWLEVMNLVGSRSSCDPLLRDVSGWLEEVCSTSHPNCPN